MHLLVIGDIAWDVLIKPSRDLVWGGDVAGAVALLPGGSAANVAVWARRLGADVTLVGKIGDDVLGHLMLRHLTEERVAGKVIVVAGLATTRVGILVGQDGERAFVMDHSTVGRFNSGDLVSTLLDRADVVFVNGYAIFVSGSGAFLSECLALARRRAIPVAFDPSSAELIASYGAQRLLSEMGPLDLILANEREARALASDGDPRTLLDLARLVVVKQGARGATALSRSESHAGPAAPVTVTDTTGAGDAFDAAFLVEYVTSGSIDAALREGNRLGGYVASRLGAQPPWTTGLPPASRLSPLA